MRRRFLHIASLALAAVTAVLVLLHVQGTRRAHARFDGDLAWQRPHADAVADWALNHAGARSQSGAGDLFDHEWTLVSCQMAVLGLSQLIHEHPELRDDYLPAMGTCSDWLISEEARQFGTARWGEDVLGPQAPRGAHAYAGYLALALAMHRTVEPEVPWAADLTRLLDRLERVVERDLHRIETYPGEAYPADIASVLGALGLDGREPTAALARFRAEARDPATGLLHQSLDPRTGGKGPPRGSGTAIAAYFLSFADHPLSEELYRALPVDRVAGVSGIREYPPGASGWGDVDSGPVVLGLGVSATGFGLAGARVHGDRATYVRLHRTAGLFGLPAPTRQGGRWYVLGGSIGNSILLAMMTASPEPVLPYRGPREEPP